MYVCMFVYVRRTLYLALHKYTYPHINERL